MKINRLEEEEKQRVIIEREEARFWAEKKLAYVYFYALINKTHCYLPTYLPSLL